MPQPKRSKKFREAQSQKTLAAATTKKQTTKEIKSVLEATGLSTLEEVQDATTNDPAMLEAIQELFRLTDEACSHKLQTLSRKQTKVAPEDRKNIFTEGPALRPRSPVPISDGTVRYTKSSSRTRRVASSDIPLDSEPAPFISFSGGPTPTSVALSAQTELSSAAAANNNNNNNNNNNVRSDVIGITLINKK